MGNEDIFYIFHEREDGWFGYEVPGINEWL
jgi:hypothetical protein